MEFLIGTAVLLLIGLIAGRASEKRHFAELERREGELRDMLVTDIHYPPDDVELPRGGVMIIGDAVIATDYLKSFIAKLINIVGGRIGVYESLLERARREAIVRVLQEARNNGYDAVCNIRIDTADIGGMAMGAKTVTVAISATGTAYKRRHMPVPGSQLKSC
ncbi:MAG: heavy metal-binding domain-containing protein [Planctomycetota bacterium]|nr:heavy metal-binding domain-containing protein [Planctomycetota bacterium]